MKFERCLFCGDSLDICRHYPETPKEGPDREAAILKLVEALEEIKNNLQTEDVYGNKDIAKEALSIWQKANE